MQPAVDRLYASRMANLRYETVLIGDGMTAVHKTRQVCVTAPPCKQSWSVEGLHKQSSCITESEPHLNEAWWSSSCRKYSWRIRTYRTLTRHQDSCQLKRTYDNTYFLKYFFLYVRIRNQRQKKPSQSSRGSFRTGYKQIHDIHQ